MVKSFSNSSSNPSSRLSMFRSQQGCHLAYPGRRELLTIFSLFVSTGTACKSFHLLKKLNDIFIACKRM